MVVVGECERVAGPSLTAASPTATAAVGIGGSSSHSSSRAAAPAVQAAAPGEAMPALPTSITTQGRQDEQDK